MKRADEMRVAVVLTSFHPGGSERQMVELVRRLDRDRFRVSAPCLHREGAWLPRVTERADEVPEFPLRGFAHPSAVTAVREFSRWCRERAIDVVLTGDFYANVIGLAGAALARVPVRIGSRRDIAPGRSLSQLALQRAAYGFAHRIVANCPAAAARLNREGIRSERVRVIPNGIDHAQFPVRPATRPMRTMITVANLRPEKRHDLLVEAIAALAPRHPDVRAQFVGDGPCRAALEQQVRDRGLVDRVEFLGHREDVPALLAAADLFVLPSRTEAFPNGVLEAMAAGLPVVACAVGGLLDMIDNGTTGILVAADDAAALTIGIDRLLSDRASAARIAAAGRTLVHARYGFDQMVSAFERLFTRELVSRGGARARRAPVTVS